LLRIIPFLCAAALLTIACGSKTLQVEDAPPAGFDIEKRVVGQSVEGRNIEVWKMGSGEDVVLFIASIHGNENRGTPLMRELVRRIEVSPEILHGRTIVVMPVANPDGVAYDTRTNVNGVDLNRNFSAANRENSERYGMEGLSEPESRAIDRVLWDHYPDRIVTLHEPLDCVDYDGPAEDLARHMAEHDPLEVKKLGSRPGSLGSYAGVTLGIPIITYELPRNARGKTTEELWPLYGQAMVAAITFPEEPPVLPAE
jgi:protein MpaA